MDLEGTKLIHASREAVWAMLHDPVMLKAALPGCTELTGSSAEGFQATAVQKVGPVKATFKGAVTLADLIPPQSYRIIGEGKGGVAGFAKGEAEVHLREVEGGTELTYKAEMQVGGKLAQLGNRIIGGFARKVTDEFFDRFVTEIEAGGPPKA